MKSSRKILFSIFAFFFMPFTQRVQAKSNLTEDTNQLYLIVTIISVVVLALVVILWVLFIQKYREDNQETDREPLSEVRSKQLEVGWTVVASVIIIFLMFFSYPVLFNQTDAAQNVEDGTPVIVEATPNWEWLFHLEDGRTITPDNSSTEHKPADYNYGTQTWTEVALNVGETYTFILYTSSSYIHSFYVHDLNIKMDVVPGVNNTVTVTIQEAGVFPLYCAEFCGAQHSFMRGAIVAE